MDDFLTVDFSKAEQAKRGRKPVVVIVEVERAVALLADDGATVPLAWRRGRSRRTFKLPDGRKVALWVRKDAPKGWKPPMEWKRIHSVERIYIPADSDK